MSSYGYFCFLQHIRSSEFAYVNSSAGPPFGRGLAVQCGRRDVLVLCAEHSGYRDAPSAHASPSRCYSHCSVLRISLVGYRSQTLCAHVLENDPVRSLVSVSSPSSVTVATAAVAAASACAAVREIRVQVASPVPRSSYLRVRGFTSSLSERERQGTQL
jgi:hypothetical protein